MNGRDKMMTEKHEGNIQSTIEVKTETNREREKDREREIIPISMMGSQVHLSFSGSSD
jgi:hypothetical protein